MRGWETEGPPTVGAERLKHQPRVYGSKEIRVLLLNNRQGET